MIPELRFGWGLTGAQTNVVGSSESEESSRKPSNSTIIANTSSGRSHVCCDGANPHRSFCTAAFNASSSAMRSIITLYFTGVPASEGAATTATRVDRTSF